MQNKKLIIAVIGNGKTAKMHIENIILHMPNIEIKVIFDKHLKVDHLEELNTSHIKVTNNEDDVLLDEQIQAVVIAASTSAHVYWVEKAISHKKHIFCEKPVSNDSSENYALYKKAQDAKLSFQVAFNRRFDPEFSKVKKSYDNKEVGNLYMIKIINRDSERPNYRFIPKSGGMIFDFNSHDFDMVHFLTGENIKEVYAMCQNLVDPKIGELGDVDTALISLRLKSGVLVNIDCSRETGYGYDQQLEIFGSNGSIKAGNVVGNALIKSSKEGVFMEKPKDNYMIRYKVAYLKQMRSFLLKCKIICPF